MKNLTDGYLDELRESMDLAVQDLGEAEKNFEAEVMMQAAVALDGLRRQVAMLQKRAANTLIIVANTSNRPDVRDLLANNHFSV